MVGLGKVREVNLIMSADLIKQFNDQFLSILSYGKFIDIKIKNLIN